MSRGMLDCKNTFCIGDNHFFHKNIIKYENRPFDSVESMNEEMIKRWNSVVNNKSKVIIFGDWIFGSKKNIENIAKQLNGHKILILGNHDGYSPAYYYSIGVEEVSNYPIVINNFIICSHEPLYVNDNMPYINLYAHVHGNNMYKTISENSACLSAERWNYTPVSLSKVLEMVEKARNL